MVWRPIVAVQINFPVSAARAFVWFLVHLRKNFNFTSINFVFGAYSGILILSKKIFSKIEPLIRGIRP